MTGRVALVLVDLQRDFLADPKLEPDAATLTRKIAELLGWFRGQGRPVVHVQTRIAADLSDAMPHWRQAGKRMCIDGTNGADAPADLAPAGNEPVVAKRSYDGFENPELESMLRELGVEALVVCGVHTHACIRTTAVTAYGKGFEVLLALDGIGSYDPAHAALTLDWLGQRAVRCLDIASIKDIVAGFSAQPAQAGPVFLHRDPKDWLKVLHEVPASGWAEVSGAAGRLNDRQKQWAARPLQERRERLLAWHAILDAARDDWTTMLVRDVGKPLRDVQGEIGYALALLEHCCRSLEDFEQGEGRSIRYRPLGTVGIITPWNNPFAMPVSKLAPALAYGNCVVWKPALEGTAMARALKQSLEEAGLGDLVELVTGGADAGRALVEAPGLAAIAFTGSVKVGREIATRCGRLMRPVQAELGGNNAAIVLVDADLSLAAEELAAAMFSFAGQRCTAIRRVIVERSAYAEFAKLLRTATLALKTGDPADPDTQVGPLISRARQQELLALVERAASEGAEILTGGSVPTDCSADGCWMLPTIVARLPEDSPILGTELFGPVVALVEADDLDAALAEHNRGEMGLLGALFSNDKEAQARFLAEAEAGMLLLNQARPAFSPAGPFVGWKNSGYGIPEHGRWNRDFYTRTQAVYGE